MKCGDECGPFSCGLERGHDGEHRNANGRVIWRDGTSAALGYVSVPGPTPVGTLTATLAPRGYTGIDQGVDADAIDAGVASLTTTEIEASVPPAVDHGKALLEWGARNTMSDAPDGISFARVAEALIAERDAAIARAEMIEVRSAELLADRNEAIACLEKAEADLVIERGEREEIWMRRQEAAARIKELEDELADSEADANECDNRVEKAEEQRDRLKAWIVEHHGTEHTGSCDAYWDDKPCDCGLAAALADEPPMEEP